MQRHRPTELATVYLSTYENRQQAMHMESSLPSPMLKHILSLILIYSRQSSSFLLVRGCRRQRPMQRPSSENAILVQNKRETTFLLFDLLNNFFLALSYQVNKNFLCKICPTSSGRLMSVRVTAPRTRIEKTMMGLGFASTLLMTTANQK